MWFRASKGGGRVLLDLARTWLDGTTHLRFDPSELLERLATATQRPRVNLIFYHVLARLACGGRLRFIATIESPEAIRRILAHLGLPI